MCVDTGEERETQLEAEVDSLKAQLQELDEHRLATEASLLESKHVFDGNLKDIQEKASMLSAALDKEIEGKETALAELAELKARLDQVSSSHQDLQTVTTDREKQLNQQIEELTKGNAITECELKNAKYEPFTHYSTSAVDNPLPNE